MAKVRPKDFILTHPHHRTFFIRLAFLKHKIIIPLELYSLFPVSYSCTTFNSAIRGMFHDSNLSFLQMECFMMLLTFHMESLEYFLLKFNSCDCISRSKLMSEPAFEPTTHFGYKNTLTKYDQVSGFYH